MKPPTNLNKNEVELWYQSHCTENLTPEQVKERCLGGICFGGRCRSSSLNASWNEGKKKYLKKRFKERGF